MFAFFVATIGLQIFHQELVPLLNLIYVAGVLALIYTIIAQAFFIKAWCRLCLTGSAVILAQSILLVSEFGKIFPFPGIDAKRLVYDLFIFALLYLGVLFFVHRYRELVIANNRLREEQIRLKRFKRSPSVISNLIGGSQRVKWDNNINPITFGNLVSKTKIVLVLSLYCGYCKTAFEELLKFSYTNPSYKYELIFNHPDLGSKEKVDIFKKLFYVLNTKGNEAFLKELEIWFKTKKSNLSMKDEIILEKSETSILLSHRNWCNNNGIFYTPALIINNIVVPNEYNVSDLNDIIETIIEDGD